MLSPVLPLQVPGGYQDSLSSNTELGRAVQNACDELDNLSNLVQDLDTCAVCLRLTWFSCACICNRAATLAAAGKGIFDKSQ